MLRVNGQTLFKVVLLGEGSVVERLRTMLTEVDIVLLDEPDEERGVIDLSLLVAELELDERTRAVCWALNGADRIGFDSQIARQITDEADVFLIDLPSGSQEVLDRFAGHVPPGRGAGLTVVREPGRVVRDVLRDAVDEARMRRAP